jgi:protein O-GlcNAc transferase
MTDSNHQPVLTKEQIDSVVTLYSNGHYKEAIEQIKTLNETYPNVPLLFNLVGACYKALGQLEGSAKMFKTAVEIKPDYAEAHKNLGITLRELGQFDEAVSSLKKAISVNAAYVDAHYNLAITYKGINQLDNAVQSYQKAIEINPDFAEAHNNLGNVYRVLGRSTDARASYQKAIEINPDFAEAFRNLGNSYRQLKQREDALNCYESARNIKPELDFIWGDVLISRMQLCIWNGLSELLDQLILKINNNETVIAPFPLLPLIDNPQLFKKNSEIFSRKIYPKSNQFSKISSYNKHQKIRIGYFSGDFRNHPLAYLSAGLYETHDRDHFEIHAFSLGPDTNDEMNLRIKAGVDHFHNVQPMSHKEIVELARSLEIDIAVDLAGFTSGARTKIFAMSAAPIQLSYLGWLGTMGADYYDYLIADPVMIPKENQKYYVEKIVYLPSFQVNDSKDLPPDIVMTRKDAGLPEEGFVFCCFNTTYKITPSIFDSWARILNQVNDSYLFIYAESPSVEKNLTNEILKRGVMSSRLIFGSRLNRNEYLARYRVADLFLDTHPCNAGTTGCDALKMGLPLLTMQGNCFNTREAASILNSINLPELITNTPEEYESLAIQLGNDPEKMQAIKDKLANNLSSAPLFDTKRFTKNIEAAYNEMYERHHKGLEPEHIYIKDSS